jgi:hypothetical protein
MPEELLCRIERLAADAAGSGSVKVTANGEGYYAIERIAADGTRAAFPPVWIDPASGDGQIRDKLAREFAQALHPESAPDDVSVPNLETEGRLR